MKSLIPLYKPIEAPARLSLKSRSEVFNSPSSPPQSRREAGTSTRFSPLFTVSQAKNRHDILEEMRAEPHLDRDK